MKDAEKCAAVYLQGVRAKLGLQQSSSLQKEDGDVEGVDVGVRRGAAGHELPQQNSKRPLREDGKRRVSERAPIKTTDIWVNSSRL